MQDNMFSMPHSMESDRLLLYSMPLKELEELLSEGQTLLPESVLSDVIRRAIRGKTGNMKKMPEEVHPWFSYWRI